MQMETNIEILITQAATSNSREDHDALYEALRGHDVFFNTKFNGEGKAISSPLLRLPSGQRAMMLYTSQDNERLVRPFGGGPWEKALGLMVNMEQADGVILSNRQLDSVSIDKSSAKQILKRHIGGNV